MNFKNWLLQERRYTNLINDEGEEFTVYLNPTFDEIQMLIPEGSNNEVRGFIDHQGHIFVWDESKGVHEWVAHKLNEDIRIPFYVNYTSGYYLVRVSPWAKGSITTNMNGYLQNNPKIKAMLGQN